MHLHISFHSCFLFILFPKQGSIPNMNNIVNAIPCLTPEPKSHSFVDTIQDKLHQLSHLGHDDNKSKSGK